MKIVQYCNYLGPARDSMGAERVVESLTRALIQLGHEVVMIVDPNTDKSLMPAPLVSEPPEDFDIIHVHGGDPALFDTFNLPWVNTIHGGGSDPEGIFWHNSSNHICVSDFICKLSNNSAYVHSFVDPDDFVYKDNKQNYFAWLAGTDWGEGKGLFTAINLAKKMKFKLKIAGTGKNKKIISQIRDLCDNNIEYVGAINGKMKADFLANAKALLFYTRLPDACPLTVAESLISGTPVIGSINGALPELIQDGITGILCPEEKYLMKAVAKVGKIKSLDCKNYALQHYSSLAGAKKYLNYYKNMINYGNVAQGSETCII